MKITAAVDIQVDGKKIGLGETSEVNDQDARFLISNGLAQPATEKEADKLPVPPQPAVEGDNKTTKAGK